MKRHDTCRRNHTGIRAGPCGRAVSFADAVTGIATAQPGRRLGAVPGAAICVDQVIGSREIVVKPTGPQVNSIPGIFGATVMGDGSVVVILDVAPLVRRAVAHR